MSKKNFTEPEDTAGEWADVRMTNPEEGEWDIDVVVAGGEVRYVDLRVKPELLTTFLSCLIDDVSDEQAGAVLADVAACKNIELPSQTNPE